MNELELREMNRERIIYQYLPEGKGESGEVVYVFADGHAFVAKRAPDDQFEGMRTRLVLKWRNASKRTTFR